MSEQFGASNIPKEGMGTVSRGCQIMLDQNSAMWVPLWQPLYAYYELFVGSPSSLLPHVLRPDFRKLEAMGHGFNVTGMQ